MSVDGEVVRRVKRAEPIAVDLPDLAGGVVRGAPARGLPAAATLDPPNVSAWHILAILDSWCYCSSVGRMIQL